MLIKQKLIAMGQAGEMAQYIQSMQGECEACIQIPRAGVKSAVLVHVCNLHDTQSLGSHSTMELRGASLEVCRTNG